MCLLYNDYPKKMQPGIRFYFNMNQVLSAVIHKEKKFYVAECPEVGTVSQGETPEDAIRNLKEATQLYLEEFSSQKSSRPLISFFEVTVSVRNSKGLKI